MIHHVIYEADGSSSDPAIDPGGRIEPPTLSKVPLLGLKIQPRITPYLASDTKGSFIIDTPVSPTETLGNED